LWGFGAFFGGPRGIRGHGTRKSPQRADVGGKQKRRLGHTLEAIMKTVLRGDGNHQITKESRKKKGLAEGTVKQERVKRE